MESLSAYARQFLERMEKPDVDEISGIAPAVAIRQKNSTRNPRSTVATATEIYDYLRLLFARCGQTFCFKCGSEVQRDTLEDIATRDSGAGAGAEILCDVTCCMASPARSRRPTRKTRARRRNARRGQTPDSACGRALRGFAEARVQPAVSTWAGHEFSTPESLLDVDFAQPVYVLVDRLAVNPEVALAAGRFD